MPIYTQVNSKIGIWASVKAPPVESKKTGSYYNIDLFFLTSTSGL